MQNSGIQNLPKQAPKYRSLDESPNMYESRLLKLSISQTEPT